MKRKKFDEDLQSKKKMCFTSSSIKRKTRFEDEDLDFVKDLKKLKIKEEKEKSYLEENIEYLTSIINTTPSRLIELMKFRNFKINNKLQAGDIPQLLYDFYN